MDLGQLKKMELIAYKDDSFSEEKRTGDTYEVLINPDSYAITYGLEINPKSTQGASESVNSVNKRMPQSITFKFLFDGTGVVKKGSGGLLTGPALPGVPAKRSDVMEDYSKFKKVVYKYDGSTHQPNFVQIRWGALHYNCLLTRMTLTFKLFSPDGNPLRAEADCTFTDAIDLKTLTKNEGKKSPDLTHIRTVIAGDTLPLLCYREYGDSKYYYQVAQFNGLTDFKTITPGTKLIFPPIAK